MKKNILTPLIFLINLLNLLAQDNRVINVDFNQVKGKHNSFYNECIGAGRANEGLRADWQNQLKQVRKDCGFKYIRFHGIFHDDMGVYSETENGIAQYNWQYIDKLYDFILEIGMKPFVELSFIPKDLSKSNKTVFWWKGNIDLPKSYIKYYNFIKAFTQHLTDRYSNEEVSKWYFEVWNEPNHPDFFVGSQDDYFELYANAANAIKKVSKNYKVGGPASAGGDWVTEILEFSDNNNIPLDFISTHAYNVNGFLDEFGTNQLQMLKDPNGVINQVKNASHKIKKSKVENVEFHISEWSSSYSPRDPVHDTYQNASFVLNTLKNVEDEANSMSYWVFTDIFEEAGIPKTPFHGGFGLINLQGIKKPTYYVFEFLNKLGNIELVNKDKQSWVCKKDSNIQLLIWDFTYLNQSNESNQVFYKKKIPSKQKSKISIHIENIENGAYELIVYKTGYKQNDAYTSYLEMESPKQLSKEQVDHLKNMSKNLPIKREHINVQNGIYKNTLSLNENDIVLIILNKIKI